MIVWWDVEIVGVIVFYVLLFDVCVSFIRFNWDFLVMVFMNWLYCFVDLVIFKFVVYYKCGIEDNWLFFLIFNNFLCYVFYVIFMVKKLMWNGFWS